MSRTFAVAGMQLWVSAKGNNLDYLETRLDQLMAAYPWVQMVVFSELAACGAVHAHAEPLPGPTEARFAAMARRHGLWLITGSMYEQAAGHVYNTLSVVDPSGEIVVRYRKIFPFTPFSVGTAAGDRFAVFDVPGVGRFGVSICYDMWFPEHSRTLAAMGAEVLVHPVMTPTIDRELELSIVRATAAFNQCYVVDINGAGGGGAGRSLVVGPDGDVVYQAGANEELIPLEIDLERVSRSRERGLLRLGQPLKSFRDSPVRFEVYDPGSPLRSYLHSLGPVRKPLREIPGESSSPAVGQSPSHPASRGEKS